MSKVIVLTVGCLVALSCSAKGAIINGATATASSTIPDSGFGLDRIPAYVVNGSGLEPGGDDSAITPDQRHLSNNGEGVYWMSSHSFFGGVDPDPWFKVDLGAIHAVAGVRVFNYSEYFSETVDAPGAGVRHVDIAISDDDVNYTVVASNFEIAKAVVPAAGYHDVGTYYSVSDITGGAFTQASFRYLRLDILSNWNGDNVAYGLAELQFEAVPEPATGLLVMLAVVGLAASLSRKR